MYVTIRMNKRALSGFIFLGSLFLFFFLCSVQYKMNNEEAVRPFYKAGMVWLFFWSTIYGIVSARGRINRIAILRQAFQVMLMLVLAYMLFSAILSGERQVKDWLYFLFWFYFVSLMLVGGFALNRNPDTVGASIFWVIVIFAVFASTVAIATFFDLVFVEYGNYKLQQMRWTFPRIHGFMGEPTSLGGLLGLSILSLVTHKGCYRKGIFLMLFALLTISLIWSGSRNGLISAILALVVWWGVSPKIKVAKLLFNISIWVLFCLFVVFLFSWVGEAAPGFFLIALDRGDLFATDENSRLFIWGQAISLFYEGSPVEWLLGRGAGTLRVQYRAAFNAPLEILFDYGILALGAYLLAIIVALRVGYRKYRKSSMECYRTGLALITYAFVFTLFISWFPAPFFNFPVFAMVFGLVIVSLPVSLTMHCAQCHWPGAMMRS